MFPIFLPLVSIYFYCSVIYLLKQVDFENF
jgi:hypothetical protein